MKIAFVKDIVTPGFWNPIRVKENGLTSPDLCTVFNSRPFAQLLRSCRDGQLAVFPLTSPPVSVPAPSLCPLHSLW